MYRSFVSNVTDNLLKQGESYFRTGQFGNSLKVLRIALAAYRAVGNHDGELCTLHNLGSVYTKLEEQQLAQDTYWQAVEAARVVGNTASEAIALTHIGNIQMNAGYFRESTEQYLQALTIARSNSNPNGEISMLNNLASAHLELEQFSTSIEFSLSALSVAVDIDDLGGQATALNCLGIAYNLLGEFAKSIEYHRCSGNIARKTGNRSHIAYASNNLGITYTSMGMYKQALKLHQEALVAYREIGNAIEETNALLNISTNLERLAKYKSSLECSRKALEIVDKIGYLRNRSDLLHSLGNACLGCGQYAKAIKQYERALEIARKTGRQLQEARAIGSLSLSYCYQGNYQKAITLSEDVLAISRELHHRNLELRALSSLGNVFSSIGSYHRALSLQQEALGIARNIEDLPGEAFALGSLNNTHMFLGNYQQSIELSQQAMEISQRMGNRKAEVGTLLALSATYSLTKDFLTSIEFSKAALALALDIESPVDETVSLHAMSVTYGEMEELTQSLDCAHRALVIARRLDNQLLKKSALQSLGATYFRQGELGEAETFLLEAAIIEDGLRPTELSDRDRTTLLDAQVRTYGLLEQVLVLKGKLTEALQVSERGRARSLVQLIVEREMKDKEDTKLSFNATPFSAKEIRETACSCQSYLVEYSLAYTLENIFYLHIWVIEPTGAIYFKSVMVGTEMAAIADLIAQSREKMGLGTSPNFTLSKEAAARTIKDTFDTLRSLYRLLIEPIEQWLPTNTSQPIIFIPQGELFLVPFAALLDGSDRHLVERYIISIAPSIQSLAMVQQRMVARRVNNRAMTAMVVGNPKMPVVWNIFKERAERLLPLPGAEREARSVAMLLNTQPLIGVQASESAVKNLIGEADIIHLATHGLLDWGDTKSSVVQDFPGAIALASDDLEDGLLTSAEIAAELNLKADLAVLSACDTGLGRISGEGTVGLARSLLAAGASSVVVSLWSVSDRATEALMIEFYRQIQQPGQSKAAALRSSMLLTMKRYPNPTNWAAFTLIGEATSPTQGWFGKDDC